MVEGQQVFDISEFDSIQWKYVMFMKVKKSNGKFIFKLHIMVQSMIDLYENGVDENIIWNSDIHDYESRYTTRVIKNLSLNNINELFNSITVNLEHLLEIDMEGIEDNLDLLNLSNKCIRLNRIKSYNVNQISNILINHSINEDISISLDVFSFDQLDILPSNCELLHVKSCNSLPSTSHISKILEFVPGLSMGILECGPPEFRISLEYIPT